MKFKIYAGLSGSFNDRRYLGTFSFDHEEEAIEFAFDEACEIYDSYAGSNGLPEFSEIFEAIGGDEEEAYEIFADKREEWLYYDARLVKD